MQKKSTTKKKVAVKRGRPAGKAVAPKDAASAIDLRTAKEEAKKTYSALREAVVAHKKACTLLVRHLECDAGTKKEFREAIAGSIAEANSAIAATKPTSFKCSK